MDPSSLSVSREQDTLIITKDRSILKELENGDFPLLHIVYCTDNHDVVDLPQNMDIWPAAESQGMRLHRFCKLAETLSDHFYAWLYENYLITTIDAFPDLIWFKSADGLHWLVNKKFEETVHKTREQCHGMGHNYIWDVPPEDCGKSEFRCLESEKEVMEKQCTCISDEHVKMAEGMRHVLTYKTPLYDRLGKIMGTTGMGHDVTDLNNSRLEIQMLIENMPFPILMCDANYGPLQLNSKFEREFSISKDAISSFDYQEWKQATFREESEKRYIESNHTYTQSLSATINGKTAYFIVYEQAILDYFGNISGFYCLYQNVTIEHEYEQMILTYAYTDALTKLYNRRYFFEYLQSQAGKPITVLFMDMDNFKSINDTLGHATGDVVLCTTAESIRKAFPEALIARLGGDEFAAAIIGKMDDSLLAARIQHLQDTIEQTFAYMNLDISISIGSAYNDGSLTDMDAFLNESDEQMYRSKQLKKRHFRSTPR